MDQAVYTTVGFCYNIIPYCKYLTTQLCVMSKIKHATMSVICHVCGNYMRVTIIILNFEHNTNIVRPFFTIALNLLYSMVSPFALKISFGPVL